MFCNKEPEKDCNTYAKTKGKRNLDIDQYPITVAGRFDFMIRTMSSNNSGYNTRKGRYQERSSDTSFSGSE